MKRLIELVEIPAADFGRAVKFYETVLGYQLAVCDECDTEKMAFFADASVKPNVAIAWAEGFLPSTNGVLVSLTVEGIEVALERVQACGGKVLRPKTKIEVEGMGYFASFADSEGNTLGLYADK